MSFVTIEFALLLFSFIVFWCINPSIGFKLTFTYASSIYLLRWMESLINDTSPSYLEFMLSPQITLLLLTAFYVVFIEHFKNKLAFSIIFLILLIVCSILFNLTIYSAIYSIFIGLFIGYMLGQASIWTNQIPDSLKFFLAIAFPISLFFLFHTGNDARFAIGIMLGASVGYQLELIKVHLHLPKETYKRIGALLIGVTGLFISYFIIFQFPFILNYLLLGVVFGFWSMWIAPIVFITLKIYKVETLKPFHNK